MHQSSHWCFAWFGSIEGGPCVANAEGQACREQAEESGRDPHGVEVDVLEHGLADDGSNRKPGVQGEREVAECFAASLVRRDVVDRARCSYVESSFAYTCEQAESDEHPKCRGGRVAGDRKSDEDRASEHQDAPALAIAEGTDERPEQHCRNCEGSDCDTDRDLTTAQRAGNEQRNRRDDGSNGDEVTECGQRDQEEGRRDQPRARGFFIQYRLTCQNDLRRWGTPLLKARWHPRIFRGQNRVPMTLNLAQKTGVGCSLAGAA